MLLTRRCLVLHPYYKLHYFEMKWGGEDEQQEQIRAGNTDARNWVRYARDVIERMVSLL